VLVRYSTLKKRREARRGGERGEDRRDARMRKK
jgi:hypothetical protein